MALMLKNARLIDPQIGLDEVADILIRDGKIVEVGTNLTMEKGVERDLAGKIVTPGLVDMHVHFRDPGQEQKEDIASGSRAAAHGGFTAVCTMPNTSPVVDDAVAVEYVKARAAAVGKCRVVVAGACSKDLKGEVLSDMGDMYAHGAPVFTDDGHGIQDAGMMRRVMDYANQFDTVVMAHCQDDSLVADSQVNEGVASTRLGMVGWPAEGEELEIARDIALCRLTGCPLHIQHITTKRGLDLVAAAKAEAADWQDKYVRLHAEWDTYRRRMTEQREAEKVRATEKLMESLIPVLDDFARTVDYAETNGETGLLGGVKAVQAKLSDTLAKGGLVVISPAGEAFDALECQAVGTVDDPSVPDETVAQVYQPGYKMGTKVIRPAMVTITTGGPKREKPEEE